VHAYPSVVRYTVSQIASDVDRRPVDAGLERRGLAFRITPEAPGVRLDRGASSAAIVAALASLQRGRPVRLPTVVTAPKVTRDQLAAASRAATTAVSAPVTFTVGPTRFRLPRWRIAQLLDLPGGGKTQVEIGGPAARSWLSGLAHSVRRPPRDATFRVVSGGIEIVPSRVGRALDVDAARIAVERATFSPTNRSAKLATHITEPARTTADAEAMGITGIVGSYTTTYGGTPGRLHNVQLVAELIDGALIAPGSRFSFNQTTGERNADKGFEEAPVIINGELQTGIGGGVCQVSTTVFNAAFEAGLSIERRTNHALYISHYPLGRDATVNYPDLDLIFTNDTDKWLLVRTFVGAGSLTVNLYGTPPGRRVETETAPLQVDGKVPIKRVKDKTLLVGTREIESMGEPPRKTSVTRRVYDANGGLLYDTTWSSYYVGEPRIVRVGTKPKPKPKAEPAPTEPVTASPSTEAPIVPRP
jgi:vancomycin resistance protein YoaR